MAEPNIGQQAVEASRRKAASQMRMDGYLWPEIAERCGYDSPAQAFADVVHGLRADRAAYEETVDDLRELEYARLEKYSRMAMETAETLAEANPEGDNVKAIDLLRKLSVEKINLKGLKAPAQLEITSHTRYTIEGFDPDDLV